jgi:hypothetical protein
MHILFAKSLLFKTFGGQKTYDVLIGHFFMSFDYIYIHYVFLNKIENPSSPYPRALY